MKGMISAKDMKSKLAEGVIAHIKWISYDRNRGTGGVVKEDMDLVMLRPKDGHSLGRGHYENYTRNFEQLVMGVGTGRIVKIHIPLIIEFNGLNVSL